MPGPWRSLPYQRGILDVMGNDDIEEVSVQKCKRVGYTKMIVAVLGYYATYLRRSSITYQPIDEDAREFMADEIEPMLRDCATVGDALIGDPEKRGPGNTMDEKRFAGCWLRARGGRSERSYRRLTSDLVIYDELDAMPREIGPGGDPVTLGDGRIETSLCPKSIRGSTPLIKNESHIERLIDEADVVLFRHVKCTACQSLHTLEWSRMVYEPDQPETVRHVCPNCEHAAHYGELPEMDAGGEWREREEDIPAPASGKPRAPYRLGPGGVVRTASGHRVDVVSVGFRLWSALSYYKPWSRIVLEFLRAKRAADVGDTAKLKTWITTVLGETWEEVGDPVEPDPLRMRAEAYGPQAIPSGVQGLTAAVDVQNTWLEAEIVGWGYAAESWGIETRRFVGDPKQIAVWRELDEWLWTPRTRVDGAVLVPYHVMVDSGHHADHVYRYAHDRRQRRVHAIKGRGVERDRPVVSAPTKQKRPGYTVELFTIGSHQAKVACLGQLRIEAAGAGFCHFPAGHGYDADYYDGLTAEQLVARHQRGKKVNEFKKMRERNEPFDLRCYNLAALYLWRPQWLTVPPEPAPEEDAPASIPDEKINMARRQKPARQSSNWIRNWRGR